MQGVQIRPAGRNACRIFYTAHSSVPASDPCPARKLSRRAGFMFIASELHEAEPAQRPALRVGQVPLQRFVIWDIAEHEPRRPSLPHRHGVRRRHPCPRPRRHQRARHHARHRPQPEFGDVYAGRLQLRRAGWRLDALGCPAPTTRAISSRAASTSPLWPGLRPCPSPARWPALQSVRLGWVLHVVAEADVMAQTTRPALECHVER